MFRNIFCNDLVHLMGRKMRTYCIVPIITLLWFEACLFGGQTRALLADDCKLLVRLPEPDRSRARFHNNAIHPRSLLSFLAHPFISFVLSVLSGPFLCASSCFAWHIIVRLWIDHGWNSKYYKYLISHFILALVWCMPCSLYFGVVYLYSIRYLLGNIDHSLNGIGYNYNDGTYCVKYDFIGNWL